MHYANILLMPTGFVSVGKGRRQHTAVCPRCTIMQMQGAHVVCALRALVIVYFEPSGSYYKPVGLTLSLGLVEVATLPAVVS